MAFISLEEAKRRAVALRPFNNSNLRGRDAQTVTRGTSFVSAQMLRDNQIKRTETSNIINQINNPPEINYDQNRNWFTNLYSDFLQNYKRLDRFAGGYLPGAITPIQDQVLDAQDTTTDLRKLNEVNVDYFNERLIKSRDQLLFDSQQDLLNQNFFEQFGIGRSEEELRLRNLVNRQAGAIETGIQLPKTVNSVERFNTIIRETPGAIQILKDATPESNDISKYLLMGGAILGLLLIFKRR